MLWKIMEEFADWWAAFLLIWHQHKKHTLLKQTAGSSVFSGVFECVMNLSTPEALVWITVHESPLERKREKAVG